MVNKFETYVAQKKRSILIVEDNDINRQMLKTILEDKYEITEAADGLEGLEKLKEGYRDLSLILLDVQMPNMNGYEFLEQQRKDELLASVPVIVITGSTISEDEEKCLALGASDFVTKPYNPQIIIRRIEAIIRLSESVATLKAVELDAVSGLYTKDAFIHHFQRYLDENKDKKYDMLMINVEDFSYINELYGVARGEKLVGHIGKVISVCNFGALMSCRYISDRFILMRIHSDSDVRDEVEVYNEKIHENAPINNFVLKFAVYTDVDTSVSVAALCERLSATMKTVKRRYDMQLAFYNTEMAEKAKHLKKIENCMKDALKQNQFSVYYQPKHDTKTGEISGAEALVRWIHPEYGFLSPADFIPLFEENGFITKLDLYVWNTVCEDIRNWIDDGIKPVPISVNASRRDLLSLDTPDSLLLPVNKNSIDIELLHIEITESASVNDSVILEKVKAVRDIGIKIELDDFGSGQSSLGTIRDIPTDIIKLDMSFVRNIEKQKEIVKMIISLAHALDHKIVAEGVESKEQLEILRNFGCDYIQGYYFSKPLEKNDFRQYLINNKH